MRHRNGFILSEFLISLLVYCLAISLIVSTLQLLEKTRKMDEIVQDQIALIQMRRIALIAKDYEVIDGVLYLKNDEIEQTMSLKNRHILVQPGTQIMISDIDSAYFYEDGGGIYIIYVRDEKEYTYLVCK